MLQRKAKITVNIPPFLNDKSKFYIGTEDEIYTEAFDWMNQLLVEIIGEYCSNNEALAKIIENSATHMIEWEDTNSLIMYAVCEKDCQDCVIAILPTLADAEEFILSDAEEWVYRIMMTEDPMEVFGWDTYDWKYDYRDLFLDAGDALYIQEVPVFGVMYNDN